MANEPNVPAVDPLQDPPAKSRRGKASKVTAQAVSLHIQTKTPQIPKSPLLLLLKHLHLPLPPKKKMTKQPTNHQTKKKKRPDARDSQLPRAVAGRGLLGEALGVHGAGGRHGRPRSDGHLRRLRCGFWGGGWRGGGWGEGVGVGRGGGGGWMGGGGLERGLEGGGLLGGRG